MGERKYYLSADTRSISSKVVDFILIFEEQNHSNALNYYIASLRSEGLELETEHDGRIKFIKVHAPHDMLCTYCDALQIKLPLKEVSWNPILYNNFLMIIDFRA